MKFCKRVTAWIAVLTLLFTANTCVLAADTGFTDVPENAYYADAVAYCQAHNLMNGTSATAFSPDRPITRAQLTAILWRQAGSPTARAASFRDVPADAYYAGAAAWASERGIVTGYSDGTFRPSASVSRAQFAAILWRAQGSPTSSGSSFADQSSIPAYAVNAVAWAQSRGIVNGSAGNRFDPSGITTRAQAAAILYRYLTDDTAAQPAESVKAAEETPITITVGDTVIPATLNSSVSARDLISRLPLTVSMTRGSVDYYLHLSNPLDYAESDVHSGWLNGDIGFDGTYLTMFHDREETSSSSSHNRQITLGHIGNLSLLENLGESIQATFALASVRPSASNQSNTSVQHKALIVYFSLSQRTEGVARLLQEKLNSDLYELVPAEPYNGTYSENSDRAQEEIESGNYPALSGTLPDLSQYDTILIGGPVWFGTLASPLYAYLEKTDFTGKTVAPFWTDQGTPGNYAEDFTAAVQNADRVTEFLQLTNTPSISASERSERLDAWLTEALA